MQGLRVVEDRALLEVIQPLLAEVADAELPAEPLEPQRLEVAGDALRQPARLDHQELVGDDVRQLVLEHVLLAELVVGGEDHHLLVEGVAGDESLQPLDGEFFQLVPVGQLDHHRLPQRGPRRVPGGDEQRRAAALELRHGGARVVERQIGAEHEMLGLQLEPVGRVRRARDVRAGEEENEKENEHRTEPMPSPGLPEAAPEA